MDVVGRTGPTRTAAGRDDGEGRPGWPPRPPGSVLGPSRLERHRRRALARLAVRQPRLHAAVLALQEATRRAIVRTVPRSRIRPLTLTAVALTVFDATATLVVVGTGLAVEANPLLAALIARMGLLAAMLVRTVVGVGLLWLLAWLSTWRHEVRPALLLVAVVLGAVAVVHVVGTVGAVLR